MYYTIFDKYSDKLIYTNKEPLPESLSPGEVYDEFDPEKMTFSVLSDACKVQDNSIVAKTDKELIAEGIVRLNEPFVYLDEYKTIQYRNVQRCLELNLIKTEEQCKEALRLIGVQIEKDIKREFSVGYELMVMQRYLVWIAEGKPKDDKREKKFLELSKGLKNLKAPYKSMRAKIKKILYENSDSDVKKKKTKKK